MSGWNGWINGRDGWITHTLRPVLLSTDVMQASNEWREVSVVIFRQSKARKSEERTSAVRARQIYSASVVVSVFTSQLSTIRDAASYKTSDKTASPVL